MSEPLSPAALGIKQRAIRKQNAAARRVWRLSGSLAGWNGRRASKHRRDCCRWADKARRLGGVDYVPMSAITGPADAIHDSQEPAYD